MFQLHRDIDESGVSGTGAVAEGVVFNDGTVAMRWRTKHSSTCIYDSIDDVETIHGHGGKTRLVWLHEPTRTYIFNFAGTTMLPADLQAMQRQRGRDL